MRDSFELFIFLKEQKLLENSPEFWWPEVGTFKTLLGAILTQNTKWTNVEKSFKNLEDYELIDLEKLSNIELDFFTNLITPSGFKNQKSKRIKQLCKNIIDDFSTFENFQSEVSRDWLLSQKGIGNESADAILCYTCFRDEMVVDKYANNLLKKFGYEFESYDDLKSWLEYGINENYDKIITSYGYEISLNKIYSRFHGKIVEYMKKDS